MTTSGSLTIVGTGIQAGQLTIAARKAIEQADKLLYFVTDPITEGYLHSLNPEAESLGRFYADGKQRLVTYMEMVDRMLELARLGLNVCAAFYGHPGVYVFSSHVAIRRAREAGIPATMLPGISAEDCLFADLGVDPSFVGCQSFEATDFLIRRRQFDVTASLILWQIGVIGVQTAEVRHTARNLDVLAEVLSGFYGPDHRAVIYEAAAYPGSDCRAERIAIRALAHANVSVISTLYVPPKNVSRPVDREMATRLGMTEEDLHSVEAGFEQKLRSIRAVTAE